MSAYAPLLHLRLYKPKQVLWMLSSNIICGINILGWKVQCLWRFSDELWVYYNTIIQVKYSNIIKAEILQHWCKLTFFFESLSIYLSVNPLYVQLLVDGGESYQIHLCYSATVCAVQCVQAIGYCLSYPFVFFSSQSEMFTTAVASSCQRPPSAPSPSTPYSPTSLHSPA